MHTYSLLSEHADRSTIAPDQLPLLDEFLERQKSITFTFPARHVRGKLFSSVAELQERFYGSPAEMLSVTVSAS
jgi:hypothetical protein